MKRTKKLPACWRCDNVKRSTLCQEHKAEDDREEIDAVTIKRFHTLELPRLFERFVIAVEKIAGLHTAGGF